MAGPAKSGVIVYAKDVAQLARFYIEMFGMVMGRETAEFISLENEAMSLVIHVPPVTIPAANFNTVKLFMTVDSLEDARRAAIELGGEALPGEWANPVFKVCNIADPEGNHIQIREFTR